MVAERVPDPPAPKVGPDGRQLRAAGLVRVSTDRQGEGHSPATQREAILARARAEGYGVSGAMRR
jgi:hypothetical protein